MEGDSLIIIGNIDWLQKSDVVALREGVLKKLELREGMRVKKGGQIGQLHDEIARLSAAKAKITAESKGNLERAKASQLLATSVIARDMNLIRKNAIPTEEVEKHKAELLVADAEILRAQEEIKINRAEYDLANRMVEEHTITAPFDGIIINVMKREQESVRGGEPVVTLANPELYRVTTFIPVDFAFRVKVGQEVLAESATRVYVDVPNVDGILRPGLQAEMTIRLTDPQVNAVNPVSDKSVAR